VESRAQYVGVYTGGYVETINGKDFKANLNYVVEKNGSTVSKFKITASSTSSGGSDIILFCNLTDNNEFVITGDGSASYNIEGSGSFIGSSLFSLSGTIKSTTSTQKNTFQMNGTKQ